ncbi:MAG: type II secretion system protein [Gammaproteobacteria bacterium]
MKTLRFLRQKGIGLLELMLSLAIIAILLIMATRYYQSASNSNNMNNAVDMVNAVRAGVKSYLSSNIGSADYPTITALQQNGYLPQAYSAPSTANPWGGPICIMAATTTATACPSSAATVTMADTYSVSISGLPTNQDFITQMQNKLEGTINVGGGESVNCAATGVCTLVFQQ